MDREFNYKSAFTDQICYQYCSRCGADAPPARDAFYRNPYVYLSADFFQFETYGDGMTQHSPAHLIPKEEAMKCLVSLAIHLKTNPKDAEHLTYLGPRVNREEIKFALSLKWSDDGKIRYFSITEKKVTTQENKRFDKRYEELKGHHVGSAEALLRIFAQDYWSFFDRYQLVRAAREVSDYNLWVDWPDLFGFGTASEWHLMRQAHDIITMHIERFNLNDRIERNTESLLHNMKPSTEPVTSVKANGDANEANEGE